MIKRWQYDSLKHKLGYRRGVPANGEIGSANMWICLRLDEVDATAIHKSSFILHNFP